MIHFFDNATLPVSRWRNGGGETREIVSFPPDSSEFSWRISIATIAADGAFSRFPGIDRVITLLEGEGVELKAGNRYTQLLRPRQPFAFAGEDEIEARLTSGVSTDFNVMTRRETHCAEVRVIADACSPAPQNAGVVYVLAGEWLTETQSLTRGQGVWWQAGAPSFAPISSGALLLLAEIAGR
ncbi:HutD family protein [Erwinia pyri]|uniref:HutD family protein n=1 Tax=Erwinia pyri TaxID=3062598 RepID=A0AA50HL37_9GAMM|nr:HutD family protein [Erwinia sp. DE2]WLS77676.1 HutD family protein [Erwinia sp. DE2]